MEAQPHRAGLDAAELESRLAAVTPETLPEVVDDVMQLGVGALRRSFLERWVRAGLVAWREGNWELIEAGLDPDVEWDISRSRVDGEVLHGREGMRKAASEFRDAYVDYEMTLEELIDRGGDSFAARVHHSGTGSTSRLPLGADVWAVYTLGAGRIRRYVEFPDREAAMAALDAALTDAPGGGE